MRVANPGPPLVQRSAWGPRGRTNEPRTEGRVGRLRDLPDHAARVWFRRSP